MYAYLIRLSISLLNFHQAKILPLRLHVDQDALDFLKAFFMFKDPEMTPPDSEGSEEIYFRGYFGFVNIPHPDCMP